MLRLSCAAVLLMLARCGDLPRPLAGRPGAMGMQLAQPPPSRLVISPPTNALLSEIGADTLAGALTAGLVDKEVPAVEDAPRRGDWSLSLSADLRDGKVVPSYQVMDPTGKQMGSAQGLPVDPAAWSAAAPTTLHDAANSAVPMIVAMLRNIDAAQQRSDPNSLFNRPARIAVGAVTGAPGDGNTSLARQMKLELPKLGEVVQDSAVGADFTVGAQVVLAQGAKGAQRIEIQWSVTDARGNDLGRVVQLNEIAPGSLDHFWGDVAMVVAQEAAGGVKNVIQNELNARAGKDAAAKGGNAPANSPRQQAAATRAPTNDVATNSAPTNAVATNAAPTNAVATNAAPTNAVATNAGAIATPTNSTATTAGTATAAPSSATASNASATTAAATSPAATGATATNAGATTGAPTNTTASNAGAAAPAATSATATTANASNAPATNAAPTSAIATNAGATTAAPTTPAAPDAHTTNAIATDKPPENAAATSATTASAAPSNAAPANTAIATQAAVLPASTTAEKPGAASTPDTASPPAAIAADQNVPASGPENSAQGKSARLARKSPKGGTSAADQTDLDKAYDPDAAVAAAPVNGASIAPAPTPPEISPAPAPDKPPAPPTATGLKAWSRAFQPPPNTPFGHQ